MPEVAVLAERIIREQELIMGPLAWREAEKVSGLSVKDHKVRVVGNAKAVLARLVDQYEGLFGPASVEVCREAVRAIIGDIPAELVPEILR